ncbi:MAG: hypothetical protein U0R23_08285 [Candidatus Nanopelagicales bacterium]
MTDDPGDEPLAAGTPRPALTAISVHHAGSTVIATALMSLHGTVLRGRAQADDRSSAVTLATLDALSPLLPEGTAIDHAQVLTIADRQVAVTLVAFPGGQAHPEVLVGSALVKGDVEDALARSVLSALNRRLEI